MAQPLAKPDAGASSGLDEAGARLAEAFRRLEAATARIKSLKQAHRAERETLQASLAEAEAKISRLTQITSEVSRRLGQTAERVQALTE